MDSKGSVVVVSASQNDAVRISSLLGSAGYSGSIAPIEKSADIAIVDACALIVVHRRDDKVEKFLDQYGALRVIVLTDCKCEDSIVQFLKQGARSCFNIDDSDRVLKFRLEAALRVHPGTAQQSFTVGDINFDIQNRRVSRAGRSIDLSPKEFEFARYLFSNPNKIVRNAELMTSVWSLPSSMDSRRIDTAACRVRKKLGLDGDSGWKLKRIKRVGYHLQNALSRN